MTIAPLVFLCLIAGPDAAADAKQRAGELLEKGNQLFAKKKHAEALEAFREAYRTFPSPKIHYNVARSLAALDQPVEAIEAYDLFLTDSNLAPSDPRHRRATEERDALARTIGKLVFVTEMKGTTITLDDRPTIPLPETALHVRPGPHNVVIETPDGRRFEEHVRVAAAETVRIHVIFPPLPPPPVQPIAQTTPVEPRSEPIIEKWWFWTAIGVAVVAVGVGVGVGVASSPGEYEPTGELSVSSTADWQRL